MNRRELMSLLGGAAASAPLLWQLAARAQQAVPVIGYLEAGAPEPSARLVAAFRKGLSEAGYVESRNVAIEFRWAQNDYERLPELAADLVRRRVAVIATPISIVAALTAKAATATIPIVFSTGADPIRAGLVASLNRPGGNVTGVSFMTHELGAKRLEILNELLPGAARFAVLVNPSNPTSESFMTGVRVAASALGRQVEALFADTDLEIDAAFETLVQTRSDALLVSPDSSLLSRRAHLATLAARHMVPAIYPVREYVETGGLMSYGTSFADVHRQLGVYCGRILGGAKPHDLPVVQPTKFELVINIKTAKSLGLAVPRSLIALADEVIE
jgi:putative tryptophan/tyrosine transport system substrate-binding protein